MIELIHIFKISMIEKPIVHQTFLSEGISPENTKFPSFPSCPLSRMNKFLSTIEGLKLDGKAKVLEWKMPAHRETALHCQMLR
jgi:hypothetical protein